MDNDIKRLSPEEALKIAEDDEYGKLKIFIGYAPGVGKTYSMLNEANRRLKRGSNVVIGYIESHQRAETEEQIGGLEIIPRKKIEYNGITLEEMDVDEIIRRKPETVLVDELAHTNVPGSKNSKRYEDVKELLSKGINVISTLNIQHLESLNDVVRQITGIDVRETVPDSIVENADEVVVVDITPETLQNRLKRGNVYKSQNIEPAMKNFFRKGNLNALRELTLRQTAQEVNEELEEYMDAHGINQNWMTAERVMVCIGASPYSRKLIRRGARIARRYKCEMYVVSVDSTRLFLPKITEEEEKLLQSHFKLARQLEGEVVRLKGKSVSGELADFAKKHHITQIIIGHSSRNTLEKIIRGSTVNKLLKRTKDIEVHIVPHE